MKKNSLFIISIVFIAIAGFGFVSWSKKGSKKVEDNNNSAKVSASSDKFITLDSVTIYGDKITDAVYRENDLTLVNIMATWCGPCVREIPELQQIDEENNGFGVVGVVVDTFDERTGNSIASAIEEAKNIASKTGAKYPMAIPTDTFLEQTLRKSAALLPMSFIVNKDGKVVKGPIPGARNKAEWLKILNTVKEGL